MRTIVVGIIGLEEDPQPADTPVMDHAGAGTTIGDAKDIHRRTNAPTGPGMLNRPDLGPAKPDGAKPEPAPTDQNPPPHPHPTPTPPPPPHPTPPSPLPRDGLLASVTGVGKTFGRVTALRGLNIAIPTSKITVLLGPNGAGKTTAIRMITGAMRPDQGQVSVFGIDPAGPDGEEVRRRCGIVSAKPSLYDRLSGWDNLRYAAELYGLGRGDTAAERIRCAATQFGIDDALDQRVGGYSTGMKTRLALARAVLHEPDLLLLDEPTSGLDPESAQSVLDMVRDMTSAGRTVLMCTHLLLEAEGLADEVVIVEAGTTLMGGRPDELARRYWPDPELVITAEDGPQLDQLRHNPAVVSYARHGDTATVGMTDRRVAGDLIGALTANGVRLVAVVPHRPSLEDLYFAVRREQRTGIRQ